MKKLAIPMGVLGALLIAGSPLAAAGDKEHRDKGEMKGCLSAGAGEGAYVLTKKKKDRTKEVAVMGGADMAAHVGHIVKLTGEWHKDDDGAKTFHATGMEHVAASCE